jgi:hypothetical protein
LCADSQIGLNLAAAVAWCALLQESRVSRFGGDFDMAGLIGRRGRDAALGFLRAVDAREVV